MAPSRRARRAVGQYVRAVRTTQAIERGILRRARVLAQQLTRQAARLQQEMAREPSLFRLRRLEREYMQVCTRLAWMRRAAALATERLAQLAHMTGADRHGDRNR